MKSRADKFLEGFKLGSLGVTKGPKKDLSVDDTSPTGPGSPWEVVRRGRRKFFRPKNFLESTHTLRFDKQDLEVPYAVWEDYDRLTYILVAKYRTDSKKNQPRFTWWLAAGKDLKTPANDPTSVSDAEWISWEERRSQTFDGIMKKWKRRVESIRQKGIDGLLADGLLFINEFVAPLHASNFKAWRDKKGEDLDLWWWKK